MTQDPIQPLAGIGRRVQQIVRYLMTSPITNQPLESYESQLHDPVVALSEICNELGAQLAPGSPVNLPDGVGNDTLHTPHQGYAFPTFSREGGVAMGALADGYDAAEGSRTENRITERNSTPGPDMESASTLDESRRRMEDRASIQDESGFRDPGEAARGSGGATRQVKSPAEAPFPPATDGSGRVLSAGPLAGRALRSNNTRHHAERVPTERTSTEEHRVEQDGGPFPEERSGETRPSARQKTRQAPINALASDVAARAENRSTGGARQSDVSSAVHDSRLTGSTQRLAAMLRAHVVPPEAGPAENASLEGEDVLSGQHKDSEPGASRKDRQPTWTRPDGTPGIEEIMEKLADELETEFVRTYGSSGG